ncbi:UNVERIFIED_CONTAM: hypothetical protein FKN15_001831 [Acipenser sinensis]
MLAVYTDAPGGPENLYLKKVPKPEPGNREVLIKVCASALNRADLLQYKANLVKSFRDNVLPHFSPDLPTPLQPVIDCVFPMDQIADAHSYMEANKNTGKIIISIDPST